MYKGEDGQTYVDPDEILEYTCARGHYGTTTWRRFEAGERCPICDALEKIYTKEELEEL